MNAICLSRWLVVAWMGFALGPVLDPDIGAAGAESAPEGWRVRSPREELRPEFAYRPQGGPERRGSFEIRHDRRVGLDGWWEKEFAVRGGEHYRFEAVRRVRGVAVARQSGLARVRWEDAEGRVVSARVSEQQARELGHVPSAEPEYPVDGATDRAGWTKVSGTYRAPEGAVRAVVELHLQWAPGGRGEWSGVEFTPTTPPEHRRVRLASVHYKPTGKSARQNCEEYAPLLAEAARQRADLVVLGETVPAVGVKHRLEDVAETVPGPTTDYFGEQARRHGLHVVLSLNEREGHLIYNTAVLLGPDGRLLGKYRKVSLPPSEAAGGTAPGHEFPVFETRFGKVGMMVCYDGFFPEVARELANRGAEVIAWPVWGCNPLLAQARACENHVYLVSSTFMEPRHRWMISAVYDRTGQPIVQAETWGSVVVAEVDLDEPYLGPYNLGDFRSMLPRHRPVAGMSGPGDERGHGFRRGE